MAAVTVVTVSGIAWYGENSLEDGFVRSTGGIAEEDRSLDGDINILLIGLDTRKDLNGNDLPKDILDQLHAGDGTEGGYNANSLILVHIPKDMKKIVAFSIPRDDYVPVTGIPGYTNIKIKEAYGLAKYYAEQKLEAQGVTDKVQLEREGREAGRASIVRTVKALAGVPINRFAEVSLVGFYHLAEALGGVDVCLNNAVDDSYYSGAVFPAGRQHLDAASTWTPPMPWPSSASGTACPMAISTAPTASRPSSPRSPIRSNRPEPSPISANSRTSWTSPTAISSSPTAGASPTSSPPSAAPTPRRWNSAPCPCCATT